MSLSISNHYQPLQLVKIDILTMNLPMVKVRVLTINPWQWKTQVVQQRGGQISIPGHPPTRRRKL